MEPHLWGPRLMDTISMSGSVVYKATIDGACRRGASGSARGVVALLLAFTALLFRAGHGQRHRALGRQNRPRHGSFGDTLGPVNG